MGSDQRQAQLPALAERQYQIGSIHARIGIRRKRGAAGARQIKAGLIEYIRSRKRPPDCRRCHLLRYYADVWPLR